MSYTVRVEVDKAWVEPNAIATVETQGIPLALCKVEDRYYAFYDRCSHEEWPLSDGYLVDGLLICSLHGAQFDPKTGACLRGPLCDGLRTFPVCEEGDRLLVEMEISE